MMKLSESTASSSLVGFNRRSFLRRAALTAAVSPFAAALLGGARNAGATPPISPATDLAILNFALNLEYLEGNYYSLGVFGQSVVDLLGSQAGSSPGTVTVKASPQVTFATPTLKQYATEIANDELAHIKFIRATISALGGTPIEQPNIDLLNSFNTVAKNAGIADTFDPYANETNFYLGGFSLTDVGVTAYAGAAALLDQAAVIAGAAGLLAVESYHDATLRLTVFNAGTDAQSQAQAISDLRDSLDGDKDKDQGVTNDDGTPNIVPTDSDSLVFTRSTRQVRNIVYGVVGAHSGGFFPNGLNGSIT